MGKSKKKTKPANAAVTAKEKTQPESPSAKSADSKGKADAQQKENKPRQDGTRETVESIVIAFVLAFLFRTFEAEAFVIPTGSMAETLYGRHKETTCEMCKTRYRISASSEIDDNGAIIVDLSDGSTPNVVNYALCPNCRYPNNVMEELSFVGDRILVNKFPYEFGDPERFDVVVFKYPEEPKTNYIKRLVGLPGETIKISWGDLYARGEGESAYQILRKPPLKQQALQIPVYNNDNPAPKLLEAGWPERWGALAEADEEWNSAENGWSQNAETRRFSFKPASEGEDWNWIRYRHFTTYSDDWQRILSGEKITDPPPAQLITDFSSYNSGIPLGAIRKGALQTGDLIPQPTDEEIWGVHWVGDLTLSCDVDVKAAQGELLLELVEGIRWYRCRVDLSSGQATLEFVDTSFNRDVMPVSGSQAAQTPLNQTGRHHVEFANVDDCLRLWVDGKLMDFSLEGQEEGGFVPTLQNSQRRPTMRDLAPVGIAARGTELEISHLNITRDVFYLSYPEFGHGGRNSQTDYRAPHQLHDLKRFLADPELAYDGLGAASNGLRDMLPNEFQLSEDEFFVLGDNSARSKDSRLWDRGRIDNPFREPDENAHMHAVPRDLLIGKAFFIYWPHGIPFLNNGRGFPVFYYKQMELSENRYGDPQRTANFVNSDHPWLSIPFYPQWQRWQRIH